jgi:hypothetical protein
MKTETRTGLLAFGGASVIVIIVLAVVVGRSLPALSPSVKVTAAELERRHAGNAAGFARDFEGKRVEVSGIAGEIQKHKEGGFYFFFRSDAGELSVMALFPKATDAVAKIKEGQKLKVTGKVKAGDLGNVIIMDATVVG